MLCLSLNKRVTEPMNKSTTKPKHRFWFRCLLVFYVIGASGLMVYWKVNADPDNVMSLSISFVMLLLGGLWLYSVSPDD
jgi:peptidoglycan/LPS O-acetylase OafA/YrhL